MKRTILVPLLPLFLALALAGCGGGGEPEPLTPPDNFPTVSTPEKDWEERPGTKVSDAPQTPAGAFDGLEAFASTFNTDTALDNMTRYYPCYTPESDVALRAVSAYHWHNSIGAIPGSMSIYDISDGGETLLGTWDATAHGGSSRNNVYWDTFPNLTLQGGHTYRFADSGTNTWSGNDLSANICFVMLYTNEGAGVDGAFSAGDKLAAEGTAGTSKPQSGDAVEIAGVKAAADAMSLDLSERTLSAEDLEKLSSLQNLEELVLYRSNITDLTPLTGLKKLRSLDIGRTAVKDLSPLASLTELETLYFFGCGAEDLSPLAALPKLRALDLVNSSALDLSPLAQARSLRRLSLASGHDVDFAGLSKLTQLESLDLSGVDFDDLTPLATLTNLTVLELTAESAKDVSPLCDLARLEELSLCGEEENLGELAVLTNLKQLTIHSWGLIDYDAVETVKAAIPGLVVDYPGQWQP